MWKAPKTPNRREQEGGITKEASLNMKPGEQQGRSFEASLEALERIVAELERGDLPLERSLELFEQGIRLSRECQERLSQAERRIEVLLRDNQGQPVTSPFEPSRERSRDSGNDNDIF